MPMPRDLQGSFKNLGLSVMQVPGWTENEILKGIEDLSGSIRSAREIVRLSDIIIQNDLDIYSQVIIIHHIENHIRAIRRLS